MFFTIFKGMRKKVPFFVIRVKTKNQALPEIFSLSFKGTFFCIRNQNRKLRGQQIYFLFGEYVCVTAYDCKRGEFSLSRS